MAVDVSMDCWRKKFIPLAGALTGDMVQGTLTLLHGLILETMCEMPIRELVPRVKRQLHGLVVYLFPAQSIKETTN